MQHPTSGVNVQHPTSGVTVPTTTIGVTVPTTTSGVNEHHPTSGVNEHHPTSGVTVRPTTSGVNSSDQVKVHHFSDFSDSFVKRRRNPRWAGLKVMCMLLFTGVEILSFTFSPRGRMTECNTFDHFSSTLLKTPLKQGGSGPSIEVLSEK